MTSSDRHHSPGPRRRLIWLSVAIVVAIITYSLTWLWLSTQVTGALARATDDARAAGNELTCDNPVARGYPFRLGLFCDAVAVRLPADGIVVGAGALRSAAQIYAPDHVIAELDGPAVVETPDLLPVRLDWQRMRASLRHDGGRPLRASLVGGDIEIALRSAGDDAVPLARMDAAEAHGRLNGAALDIAATLTDATLSDPRYATLPPAELQLDATLPEGAALIAANGDRSIRGHTIVLRTLTLALPAQEASLSADGELVIDAAGLIDGTLDIRAVNPQALVEAARLAYPEAGNEIAASAGAFEALGRAGTPLTLTIRRSRIFAGFLQLGELPPL